MTMKHTQNRDEQGRYDFDNLDLLCTCGHTLGNHSAGDSPKDCLYYSFPQHTADNCGCLRFRKARKQPTPDQLVPCAICSSKHLKPRGGVDQ